MTLAKEDGPVKRLLLRCALLALPIAAAACNPATPSGQTLALVGDVPITQRDLDAELRATGQGADVDAATRQRVLAKLVERALLVQRAQRDRIDRSPEYLAALRRSRDLLQVSLLAADTASSGPLRPAQVDAFVARRPWMFAQRAIVSAEAISLDAGAGGATLLAGQSSLDVAARMLATRGVPFARGTIRIDTALLDPASAARFLAAPDGTTLAITLGDRQALVRPIGRTPAPIDARRAPALARAIIRRQREARGMQRLLTAERARTTISYQQGYGPAGE